MIIAVSQEEMKSTAKLMFDDNNNMKMNELGEFCKLTEESCQADTKGMELTNFLHFHDLTDTLHKQSSEPVSCKGSFCSQGDITLDKPANVERTREEVAIEAKRFLDQYFASSQNHFNVDAYETRLLDILKSIQKTGSYELTRDELEFGVRLAYRNSPTITERWQWENLKVFDARNVVGAKEMFEAICDLLRYVSNGGNIRHAVTVFPNVDASNNDGCFRIWNTKLVSYAGYQQDDCSVVGDPAQVKLTEICESLGWTSPSGRQGAFDVLPLLLNAPGENPKYFEIPSEIVMQFDIKHPNYDWFQDLGLKWFAVDSVSNVAADIGGITFTAAPYCGVHLSAQVASRDLCDTYRYNILEEVAYRMGLDTMSIVNLWKDQALVEINIAVVHSFKMNNISVLDHHSASEMFVKFFINEFKLRGGCPANWTAVVPPLSSGLTNVFHQEMLSYKLKPCFEKQEEAWKTHHWLEDSVIRVNNMNKKSIKSAASAISLASYCMNKCLQKRVKATIVYASETGKSEMFAHRLGQIFQRAFNYEVVAMDDYDLNRLPNEQLILVVASTFGSGDAPQNGKLFNQYLQKLDENKLNLEKTPRFSVFALGSSAYPDFCAFGKFCDESLSKLGFSRVLSVATGDEIKSQEKSFKTWANSVFKACCDEFDIRFKMEDNSSGDEEETSIESMKIVRVSQPVHGYDLAKGLSDVHQKNVASCRMISRTQLQSPMSDRQTILVRFKTPEALGSFLPGDHLGVFPSNPSEQVRSICRRIKAIGDRSIEEMATTDLVSARAVCRENTKEGRVRNWKEAGRLPPCTIWTALSSYLDITTPPTQFFLKLLVDVAEDNHDKMAIKKLSEEDDHYEAWKSSYYPSLADVLEMFPSVTLDLRMVLTQLPLLQPRFYSISSSPQLHSNEVQLTVAVVTYTLQGKQRRGVCSNFLNDCPSDPVPCFVRSANFRLPQNDSTPVVMVGPGTGIAPFRSFWQQRMYDVANEGRTTGQMTLYFGCRQPGVDDIYSKELQLMLSAPKYNFRAKIAYSRAHNKPKKYVQHLLEEDGDYIYSFLQELGGSFFVCGEAAMAADVRKTLRNILETKGQMTPEESARFINKLKDEGRFQEDIFGVLIRS